MQTRTALPRNPMAHRSDKGRAKRHLWDVAKGDSFHTFLVEIGRYPLLKPQEERQIADYAYGFQRLRTTLAAASKQGKALSDRALCARTGYNDAQLRAFRLHGKKACEQLVTHNLRLVVSIAKRHQSQTVPLTDRVQDGIIGLMRAVQLFEPEKGYKFSTYATWWIRQGVTRSMKNNGRTIRLPIHISDKLNKLNKTTEALARDLNRRPTNAEVSAALGWDEARIVELRAHNYQTNVMSLNHKLGDDGSTELIDLVDASIVSEDAVEQADQRLCQEAIAAALDKLEPQQRLVIELRYGLVDGNARAAKAISAILELPLPHVRAIERQARTQMKRVPGLKAFLE